MKIMTTFFEVDSDMRLAEFKFCIERLCSLAFIEKYYIFFEGDMQALKREQYSFLKHDKIVIISVAERPTYKVFIDYANAMMPNEIVGIVNADIYFDETVSKIQEAPMEKRFYAVTRMDAQGRYQNPGSHDFWVFKTPLYFSPNIYIGVVGCDSFLAQRAIEAGYSVLNPCLSIHIYHKHNVGSMHKPVNVPSGNYWAAPGYLGVEIRYSKL